LCGQAPSDYPDMARYLVELGIDSMSLNPDAVIKTTLTVLEVEKSLGRRLRVSPAPERVGVDAEGVVA
jgi:pyruvate,water dikinase